MRIPLSLFFSLSLFACGEEPKEVDPLTVDDDGDGFSENDGDCDDANADLNPAADEICDEIDNDCDGFTDGEDDNIIFGENSTYYADADGDGFGDMASAIQACSQPDGLITDFNDCDDTNADINPSAMEVCDDGIDNDCDTLADDEDDSLDTSTGSTYYADMDGDGEGDADFVILACVLPENAVENDTDCDDGNADLNTADADEDGITTCGDLENNIRDCDDNNAAIGSSDFDNDGFIACIDDCDDEDSKTNPAMGTAEEDPSLCVRDGDDDGYGDANPEVAGVSPGTDCNDNSAEINNDDADGDGVSSCDGDCDDEDPGIGIIDLDGDGYSGCATDCWDSEDDFDEDGIPDSAAVYTGAAASEPSLCTADQDGDGYGDSDPLATFGVSGCFMLGLVDTGSYWDNAQITVTADGLVFGTYTNTSASTANAVEEYEVCAEGVVQFSYNCTSSYDCGAHTWYATVDTNRNGDYSDETPLYSDGKQITGVAPINGVVYTMPSLIESGSDCDDSDASTIGDDDGDGFTFCIDDCDDSDAAVNPNGTEVYYDGVDQDCDGLSDFDSDEDGEDVNEADCDGDGTMETECDFDGDGTMDWTAGSDCDDTDASTIGDDDGDGFSSCVDDCDDTDGTIHPDAEEVYYDGTDQNCDGLSDFDSDGDGDDTISSGGTDCDDTDSDVDGLDSDGDGFTSCEDSNGDVDCDDDSATTYPGAAYNESATECWTDDDGDGWGFGQTFSCYQFEMYDAWGDGWNGNAIEIYEDGTLTGTYANQDLDGMDNDTTGGETQTVQHCVGSNASTVEFKFIDGYYNSDIIFNIYFDDGADGILDKSGYGVDPNSFVFDEVTYGAGDTFYTVSTPIGHGGTDSDDTDASVH